MRLLNKSLIKLMIVSIIFLVISDTFADYSSLTEQERKYVTEAFNKSKFYKYYETLVNGKDKITITEIGKIKESQKGDTKHFIYEIKVDLIIDDKVFKRVTEFEFDLNIDTNVFGFNWYIIKESLKYIGVFIGGLLLGNIAK